MPWYTTEHARRDAELQAAQRSKTMDDSTMLDKAAKAAGMKRRSVRWNPLKNSGDALGLAATLQISVLYQTSGVEARAYRGEFFIACEPVSYEDSEATEVATCRAIVRAAASCLQ